MSNLNCTPWHNLSYILLLGALFCTCNYCTLQEILSACELKCVSNFSSFAIPLHITSETHSKFIQIIQELRNCSQTKPNYIGSYKPLGYLFTVQSIISMNPCINKLENRHSKVLVCLKKITLHGYICLEVISRYPSNVKIQKRFWRSL